MKLKGYYMHALAKTELSMHPGDATDAVALAERLGFANDTEVV